LLARLRPLLDDYEDAFESISEFRNKPSGRLRITVGAPGAHTVMAPIVALFLTRHPEVRLELSVDDAFTDIVASRYLLATRRLGSLVLIPAICAANKGRTQSI